MIEEWADVVGYEGLYQVSNKGNVIGARGRLLGPIPNRQGYPRAQLYGMHGKKFVFVHRLVAETFIPNPNGYSQVNHIDGVKWNNHVGNLEWCTASHNTRHAYDNGLAKGVNGCRNGASKLSDEDVTKILLNADKKSGSDLAREFGVSRSLICMIKKGQLWESINARLNRSKTNEQ